MQNHPVHSASTESEVTAKADDGGPAFPQEHETSGMTLRDYFAAKAMGVALNMTRQGKVDIEFNFKMAATVAYSIADAMLKARK